MRKSIAAVLMAATLLTSVAPTAAQPDARGLLSDFARGLESLQADFTQITVSAGGEVVEESTGRMAWQAPNLIRWDYLEPFPQIIVGDGEKFWHYDESLEQVTVRAQPAAEESPIFVLTRPKLLERFWRILPSERADQLRFEPLAEQSEVEKARLTFREGRPWALDIFDPFGQSTRLTLENIRRNPTIEPERFEFELPEGVDVLEGL